MSVIIIRSVKSAKCSSVLNKTFALIVTGNQQAYSSKADVQDSTPNKLKNLKNSENDIKPTEWNIAKPFEQIPGPKPIPIFGNLWRFLPWIGDVCGLDQIQQQYFFNNTYGEIVRLSGLLVRPDMIMLYNPEDIEKAFRNEGPWPIRESLPSLLHYKTDVRPEVFQGAMGLVTSQGEDWHRQRSIVNPVMMQPRSAQMYIGSMDLVAQDFIVKMKTLVRPNGGELPERFFNELNKWALESVCVIALNKRLGLLDDSKITDEAQKFIQNVMVFFDCMFELDMKPSAWKLYSTPAYKKYIKTVDEIVDFTMKHIKEEAEKIKRSTDSDKPVSEMSVFERLLLKDERIAFSMTFDLITAGVDTTSRIVGAALYFLSKNPEAQRRLRLELKKTMPTRDSPITKESLNNMTYLRAVIKETARIAPIAIANIRRSTKDLVLSGYQVPKGTDIITPHLMLCMNDKYFPQAKKFIPERWSRDEESEFSNKDVNPFIYQPFGFGARSCVAKRLANLEIEVILARIIRNFNLEWPHEDMKWNISLVHGVGSPLKFHVTLVK